MIHVSVTAAVAAASSLTVATLMALASPALARMPAAIAAPGHAIIARVRGVGAQIYECRADHAGKRTWQFREPIATLILNGKTVGRHYAGPTWAFNDGSAITGKAVASAPGATPGDVPWLRLDVVTAHQGHGELSAVTAVQRINTKGGAMAGACDRAGTFLSVPYAADYVFLRKS
ncbi:MAG TPA: DUF3455 domain-containing protein [Acetobacteraceae bacterium]|nr:DUF3455 domain-containing protein [Acetobacteraceae bacterium]